MIEADRQVSAVHVTVEKGTRNGVMLIVQCPQLAGVASVKGLATCSDRRRVRRLGNYCHVEKGDSMQ